jgi:hypothetical protein
MSRDYDTSATRRNYDNVRRFGALTIHAVQQFQHSDVITAAQAAELLGENVRTVQRRARDGAYPAFKLPGATGAYVFDRGDVVAIAEGRA